MDRLGFMVQCTRKEQGIDGPTDKDQVFKVRLPFPRGAEDRKDVKTLIVEMTQTSLANPVVQEAMQEPKKFAKMISMTAWTVTDTHSAAHSEHCPKLYSRDRKSVV